jgi:hypothetical protein
MPAFTANWTAHAPRFRRRLVPRPCARFETGMCLRSAKLGIGATVNLVTYLDLRSTRSQRLELCPKVPNPESVAAGLILLLPSRIRAFHGTSSCGGNAHQDSPGVRAEVQPPAGSTRRTHRDSRACPRISVRNYLSVLMRQICPAQ